MHDPAFGTAFIQSFVVNIAFRQLLHIYLLYCMILHYRKLNVGHIFDISVYFVT